MADGKSPDDIYGIGAARRKTIEACKRTDQLEPVESPETIDDILAAVQDIRVTWDDWVYRAEPSDLISFIEQTHDGLPDEAKAHFVADDILRRRLNAARNQFNEWLGRLQREKEMPSPVEAGPSKYPADKAQKKSRLERESNESLDDRLDKLKAGVKGARQRALNEIGSSVAEQTQQEEEQRRDDTRSQIEAGDIVEYRNPRLHVGAIVRINEKSVRVRRPNPRAGQTKPMSDEQEPDYIGTRVDLASAHLSVLSREEIEERESLPDTAEAARQHLLGEAE